MTLKRRSHLRVASLLYLDIDVLFWDSSPRDNLFGGKQRDQGAIAIQLARVSHSIVLVTELDTRDSGGQKLCHSRSVEHI